MKAETAAISRTPAMPKRSGAWKATLVLIPLVTAGLLFWLRQVEVQRLKNRELSAYGTVPPFELVNQEAQPFGSAQLAGKIWIADFIFTTCPGPCPIISTRMSELERPLEKSDVQLVSFSVDPETDTPEVLHAYAEKLKAQPARWDFLTGSKTQIYNLIEKGFHLTAIEHGGDEEQLLHDVRLVLVDRHNQIRGYYNALESDAITKLLADTNHLLREQPK